jgi:hypothetical protein
MFEKTEQLKQKLEEMLTSNDTEWVNTVTVTLNAMYRQFRLEQQDGKQIIPLGTRRTSRVVKNLKRIERLSFRSHNFRTVFF